MHTILYLHTLIYAHTKNIYTHIGKLCTKYIHIYKNTNNSSRGPSGYRSLCGSSLPIFKVRSHMILLKHNNALKRSLHSN